MPPASATASQQLSRMAAWSCHPPLHLVGHGLHFYRTLWEQWATLSCPHRPIRKFTSHTFASYSTTQPFDGAVTASFWALRNSRWCISLQYYALQRSVDCERLALWTEKTTQYMFIAMGKTYRQKGDFLPYISSLKVFHPVVL
jgi:hypothetical protein